MELPIIKEVKKCGNGGHICFPKALVGTRLLINFEQGTNKLLLKNEIITLIEDMIEEAKRY